ncbi:hypothetical protein M4578_17360 [Salipiger sp. P9]|uniref:hypothetical protein n=1 Tax=Salipiger pentaromativorans TaxID=2943193 RepID=UPI0021574EF9|nr:hypothetical protein [Salipiger pentaromativorans]MCR8549603.1 hypothetical protein [Salipiger pentaromativorans]
MADQTPINISEGDARAFDDAELGRKKFDLKQRQVIFYLSIGIVIVLTLFSITVVAYDVISGVSTNPKAAWFYDLLKILFGFVAGAIWPSTQQS